MRTAVKGDGRPDLRGFRELAKAPSVDTPRSGAMLERPDPEPVFPAPFVSSVMQVEPAWIDYNGHLNMAYYNVLFDRAVDEAYELLGCGLAYLEGAPAFHASPRKCMCAICANSTPATRCG